jgi:hypothetical protein
MAADRGNLSRKMAAIVHADVTGSTALVQLDEALAHERINAAFGRFSSQSFLVLQMQSVRHWPSRNPTMKSLETWMTRLLRRYVSG